MATVKPMEPGEMCCKDSPMYPYGTRLEFEGDLAEELGVDNFSAGETVEVRATAFVREKSEESDDGKEVEKELCLQLTEVTVKKAPKDRASVLYEE